MDKKVIHSKNVIIKIICGANFKLTTIDLIIVLYILFSTKLIISLTITFFNITEKKIYIFY